MNGQPKLGAWVRCERAAPSKGTWPQYVGRTGRVVQINDGEYGVRFTAETRTVTWFLADELVAVAKPEHAPNIGLRSERSCTAEATSARLPGVDAA